jgi:pimeloyl-ACP methyl ester carboxylesterase
MPAPLVLLPGLNCSPRLWAGVLRELGDPRERLATEVFDESLDRPSLDEQVDALLARLPPRFAVGGLSLGAIVAMAVHRRAPERVAGLFLVATNSRAPTDEQRSAWRSQLDRLESGASARDLQDELLPLLLGPDAAPAWRRVALEMADEVGTAGLTAQLRLQLTRVDERPGLRRVAVPSAVVAAGDDRICPLDRHLEIRDVTPGAELVIVSDAPHLVVLTHPGLVAEAMIGWLRRVGG